jgi:hypothetical protein
MWEGAIEAVVCGVNGSRPLKYDIDLANWTCTFRRAMEVG